jgi:type II secretory pathway pseudopilin PulG
MVELLVVVIIVLLLLSIFVPFIRKSRETEHRGRCQANMWALGLALAKYSAANGGSFPRVVYDARNVPSGYFAYTGPFASSPFAGDGRVSANDVTASLWLLVRGGYATADVFVCPSTGDYPDTLTDGGGKSAQPGNRSNFRSARNLSYSYAAPFSSAPGFKWDANLLPKDMVILADMNPGRYGGYDVTGPAYNDRPLALARANSRNHGGAGQSVLYADNHVEFKQSPYCGYGYYKTGSVGDNIFTVLAERSLPETPEPDLTVRGFVGPGYSPAWKADSYLVPTEDQDRER